MRIEDTRRVIEVLLWAGDRQLCALGNPNLISTIAFETDGYDMTVGAAILAHQDAGRADGDYGELAIEAAYRLIETSATLRREWFGR